MDQIDRIDQTDQTNKTGWQTFFSILLDRCLALRPYKHIEQESGPNRFIVNRQGYMGL